MNLCNDIETNPGPPIHSIDPTQTIKAPYSQGDIMHFGENAGKQCVAMSLSALIYNKIKGIHSCNDLVQTMEMGNQLYYISTEIYSLKSHVVNFRSEISSGQSEERTTFFTCEKNRSSNQKLRTIFFHCIG